MSCCEPSSNGQGGGGGVPNTPLSADTIFEVEDFSVGQPNGEVASGTIDLVDVARGITLTWDAQRAGATSWAIGATNGLRLVGDGVTATTFHTGVAVTATYLRVRNSVLYTAFPELDAMATLTLEAYFDAFTFNGSSAGAAVVAWGLVGAPSNAAARMVGVARGQRAAAQTSFGKVDTAEGTNYTGTYGAADTLGVLIAPGAAASAGVAGVRGAVTNPWPQYRAQVSGRGVVGGNVTTNNNDENVYLAIGMYTSAVAFVVQLRSLRIRAWR